MEVRGVLSVLSNLRQGLNIETLTAQKDLSQWSEHWHKVTASSAQDIILPDATTIPSGETARFVVQVDAGSSTINVKTYHATVPVLLRAVQAGRAYEFTLVSNTTAAGLWHVNLLEEADSLASERYQHTFNATTDWGTASGGLYSIAVPASTHGRGTNPEYSVERDDGSNYLPVKVKSEIDKASGDVTIYVPEHPDLRFAGQIRFV